MKFKIKKKIKKINVNKHIIFLVVSKLPTKFEYIWATFDNKKEAKNFIKMGV